MLKVGQPTLSDIEREVMLAVWNGENDVLPSLHSLYLHMPTRFFIPAMRYLAANRLTGKRFKDLMLSFEWNAIECQRWLTEKITKQEHPFLKAGATFK